MLILTVHTWLIFCYRQRKYKLEGGVGYLRLFLRKCFCEKDKSTSDSNFDRFKKG